MNTTTSKIVIMWERADGKLEEAQRAVRCTVKKIKDSQMERLSRAVREYDCGGKCAGCHYMSKLVEEENS